MKILARRLLLCLSSMALLALAFPVSSYATVDTKRPTWPTGSKLTAASITETGCRLDWTAATDNIGVTQYRVFRNGVLLATLGNVRTYNVGNLAAGTSYTFKVEAGDAVNNWTTTGPSAPITTLNLGDAAAPSWPNEATLTCTDATAETVKLAWTAATDNVGVTQYKVFNNGALVATIGNTLTYEVTGLTRLTTYVFRIEAGDASNNWSSNGPTCIVRTPPTFAEFAGHYCYECHASPPRSGTVNIFSKFTGVNLDTNDDLLYRHGMSVTDRARGGSKLGCENCHNPGLNNPINNPPATKVIDPDNGQLFVDTMIDPKGIPSSSVVSVTLPVVADTVLVPGETTPNGAANEYWAGTSIHARDARALMRFDLSSIPAGAQILSARLMVYGREWSNNLGIYEVTKAWDEGSATASLASTGEPWDSYGGDFGEKLHAEQIDYASLRWSSTGGLWPTMYFDVLSLVQKQAAATNHGLALKKIPGTPGFLNVFSKEYNCNPPVLMLTYTTATGTMIADDVGYCLRCHDNNPPASATMGKIPNSVGDPTLRDLTDIAAFYKHSNLHGAITGLGGPIAGLGTGGGFKSGSGYYYGSPALPCTACHDPHGSTNVYHLTENPGVKTGVKFKNDTGTGSNSLGVWCSGCHSDWPSHFESSGCTGCHRHNTGPLYPRF